MPKLAAPCETETALYWSLPARSANIPMARFRRPGNSSSPCSGHCLRGRSGTLRRAARPPGQIICCGIKVVAGQVDDDGERIQPRAATGVVGVVSLPPKSRISGILRVRVVLRSTDQHAPCRGIDDRQVFFLVHDRIGWIVFQLAGRLSRDTSVSGSMARATSAAASSKRGRSSFRSTELKKAQQAGSIFPASPSRFFPSRFSSFSLCPRFA